MVAAKLCGKPAPAGAAEVLSRLGLGAAARQAGRSRATGSAPAGPGRGGGRAAGAGDARTADAHAGVGQARQCDNNIDDDGDGQTDWQDPGCADAGRHAARTARCPVSAECAASSGVGMGEDPQQGVRRHQPRLRRRSEAVEVDVAPGIVAAGPDRRRQLRLRGLSTLIASARAATTARRDLADVMLAAHGAGRLRTSPRRSRSTGPTARSPSCARRCSNCGGRPAAGAVLERQGRRRRRDEGLARRRRAPPIPTRAARARPTRARTPRCPSPATCDVQIGMLRRRPAAPGLWRRGLRRDHGRLVQAARARRSTACFRFGADALLDCGAEGRHGRRDVRADEPAGAARGADRRRRDVRAGHGRARAASTATSTPTACPFC